MELHPIIEKIDLFLEGKSLAKIHMFEKVTPFAVVSARNDATDEWNIIGKTLAILDNRNPQWVNSVRIDYFFKLHQEFQVSIYQYNTRQDPEQLHHHTLIGECTFILSRLLRNYGRTCILPLTCSNHPDGERGTLSIHAVTVANIRDELKVTFSCNKLINREAFFFKSNPFLVISRLSDDTAYHRVWQNFPIMNTLDPCWAETQIPITTICNGDYHCPLKIEIFDFDSSGKHTFMGESYTSVDTWLTERLLFLDIIEPEKQKRDRSYVNSGKLKIFFANIVHLPLFADFITSGCEMDLIVGIDFTGSNGNPDFPTSLHYVDASEKKLNQYEQAILAVGSILEPYDTDHFHHVFGYGAKLPLTGEASGSYSKVQHCFPLLDQDNHPVYGIDGILRAYRAALTDMILSGPTHFAPLIVEATRLAIAGRCSQDAPHYTILLLLTDGVINDVDATKKAIIRASEFPISIIIIGIGEADFTAMNILDGDDALLSCDGISAKRDIVQFVPYREFINESTSVIGQYVLEEVPDQFLSYMEQHKIVPKKMTTCTTQHALLASSSSDTT